MKVSALLFVPGVVLPPFTLAYRAETQPKSKSPSSFSRRAAFSRAIFISTSSLLPSITSSANAFEGTGSSAYSGKNPASVLARRKSYQARVTEDVKDFVRLGAAINRGETDTDPWLFFFFPYERREPDATGRTFAACADFIGHLDGRERVGGDGYLLASTFTKAGKPPENTPAVKSYNPLPKAFDAIEAAGKKGDAKKAKEAYEKAAFLFSKYLADVELPGDLSDPLYK